MLLGVLGSVDADDGLGRVEEELCELTMKLANSLKLAKADVMLTVLAMSVFPVPEGPANKKLAMGRLALRRPLRERRTAFATSLTASG